MSDNRLFNGIRAAFHDPQTRIYRWVQGTVWGLIVASITLLIVEAVLPEDSPFLTRVELADRVLLVCFAVEYVLRVWTYRPPKLDVFRRQPFGRARAHVTGRLTFMLRPIMLIDLLAVLALFPELRGLRALRLLRLLRSTRVFRYRNPFAILTQSLEENGLLFLLTFGGLGTATLLGGISLYLVEARANPGLDSVVDGLWWALVTITTVGYGDIIPVTLLGRFIGGVLMIAGMFSLAMFAGVVGSSLVSGMLSIREEQFRMSEYVNHVVVCGYDESTHLLLEAMEKEGYLSKTRVVLFDCHERPRELPPDFIWVQGDPTKESELDKVRLTHAAAVIVAGERDVAPQVADARTILITFTIRSYMQARRDLVENRRSRLYLVAEILDSENVGHTLTAGADEVVETRRIGYSMIAHAVGFHGTATAMSRVLISGAHNVFVGLIPGERQKPIRFKQLMEELRLRQHGGLVVGVRTPDGEETINPPNDFLVHPDSRLLYLATEALLDPPG